MLNDLICQSKAYYFIYRLIIIIILHRVVSCIAHYPPELFIISPFHVVRSSTQSCFIFVFFTIGILDTTSRGYTSQCHMYMYTLLKLETVVLLHSFRGCICRRLLVFRFDVPRAIA